MDEVGCKIQILPISSLSYWTKSKIESPWVEVKTMETLSDFKSGRVRLSTTNQTLFPSISSAFHNVQYVTENQGRSKNMFPPIFTCTYIHDRGNSYFIHLPVYICLTGLLTQWYSYTVFIVRSSVQYWHWSHSVVFIAFSSCRDSCRSCMYPQII